MVTDAVEVNGRSLESLVVDNLSVAGFSFFSFVDEWIILQRVDHTRQNFCVGLF